MTERPRPPITVDLPPLEAQDMPVWTAPELPDSSLRPVETVPTPVLDSESPRGIVRKRSNAEQIAILIVGFGRSPR